MGKHRSILGPGGPPPPKPKAPAERTLALPPYSIRAEVEAEGASDDTREIGLVWTTGAGVERYDWMAGERYIETLSLDPAHVRLDRLNSGGPVLDSHNAFSVSDMLGSVIPGSVSLTKKEGRARVRFSKREAVTPVWDDVRDGLIRSVSVGYRVHKYEETPAGKASGNKLPVRKAIDWEPFEISMVPVPADAGASVRGQRPADTNECRIVTRADAPSTTKERVMPEKDDAVAQPEYIVETPEREPEPEKRAAEPNDVDRGMEQERKRVQGIILACRAGRLPQSFQDKLISDAITLEEAQTRVLREIAERGGDNTTTTNRAPDIRVGDDPLVHERAGIENALLHRCYPKHGSDEKAPGFALTDKGRKYRGMSLLRIAESYLNARGIRTTGISKMDLAGLAMGLSSRSGMHTTSDFPLLLADVANKTLRAAYEAAPQTFLPISRRVSLPDFKSVKRLQLGEAPALLEVLEHGEYTRGTIGEGRETFQLATYGRVFAITRKALVNDDTDAFSRVAMMFGRSARNLESDLVWQQITANAAMADGFNLFSTDHANIDASGAAIAVASLGVGRAAMRKQTGLGGTTYLNIESRYLIVPPALETVADQFVSVNLVAAQSSNVNPFSGRLQVITEPRLEGSDANAWFLAADPSQIDIIEFGSLEGDEGPRVDTRIGFDVDGMEVKCSHDFAAKVIDYRGLYKNVGA